METMPRAEPTAQAKVSLVGISQWFYTRSGQPLLALEQISLHLLPGEFVSIVGPSGCGKSTLLNIISGLTQPSTGQVLIDGRPVTGVQRNIGYMPARDALLPWRSALKNVEYGLELQGVPNREAIARRMLAAVGLTGFEDHYPNQLSQGMRQRVAIARTFASSPEILLMDEPFSALDAQTRIRVQDLFVTIWERERKTVLFVTHDVAEAIALSDRVVVFSARPGHIRTIIPVDLPRPRHVRRLHADARFQSLLTGIWDELEDGAQETPAAGGVLEVSR